MTDNNITIIKTHVRRTRTPLVFVWRIRFIIIFLFIVLRRRRRSRAAPRCACAFIVRRHESRSSYARPVFTRDVIVNGRAIVCRRIGRFRESGAASRTDPDRFLGLLGKSNGRRRRTGKRKNPEEPCSSGSTVRDLDVFFLVHFKRFRFFFPLWPIFFYQRFSFPPLQGCIQEDRNHPEISGKLQIFI